jgi:hypothetical protein
MLSTHTERKVTMRFSNQVVAGVAVGALVLWVLALGALAEIPGNIGVVNTGPKALAGLHSTDKILVSSIPIDVSSTTPKTVLKTYIPVTAGEHLDVYAQARVTDDSKITIGVGWQLWAYPVNSSNISTGDWFKLSHALGDNVDTPRHHMPLAIATLYPVKRTERLAIALRVDAHSFQHAQAVKPLTVDPLGTLIIQRWK